MRKLLIAAAVLMLLIVVVLVIAALSLNRIIAQNRDRILARVEAVVGRSVSVSHITVSVWGGLGIRLEGVRIADDPRFGTQDFVRATAVTARAALWPLLHSEIDVKRIDLQEPEIHLIRDASGQWNYSTLKPLHAEHAAAMPRLAPGFTAVAVAATAPPQPLALSVSRATIQDGTLLVTDRSREPAQTTRVDHIALTVRDASMTTPVHFDLDAALQAAAPNVHLKGLAGPLSQRSGVPLEIDGSLGPLGPQKLQIDDLRVRGLLTPDVLQLSEVEARAFDGSFKLNGQYPLRSSGRAIFKGHLSDIAIEKVLQITMKDAPKQIGGAGEVTLDLRATGNAAKALQTTLAGTVTADVHGGVIKNFNLPSEVLGKITGLPSIGNLISAKVKPKYSRLFSEPDTKFDTLHGTFHVADQRIRTDDLSLIATDYGVRAKGWMGFDRDIDMSGTLLMSKQFSSDVAADVKEAKYLLDDTGQLAIPFTLRGKVGKAKPQPDSAYLVDALTRALSRGGAGKLLDKLLGNSHRKQTPGADEGARQLEDHLRNLFGR